MVMEKTRYNLFNLIHKGLRLMMYDTAAQLQRTDFASPETTRPVINQLEVLLTYFEGHADHEDSVVLPYVQRHDPVLVDDFEKQHVEDHRLGAELTHAIEQWRNEKNTQTRRAAGRRIVYAFNTFIAFNLDHMNKEEHLLNEVLWKHYSDTELKGITQQIIQRIDIETLTALSRWMMRAVSKDEVMDWLKGVKMTAPEHVFVYYCKLAQEELPPLVWSDVRAILFTVHEIIEH